MMIWIVWCNVNLPPYCLTWLLVSWLQLCSALFVPRSHLALLMSVLPSEMPALLAQHCLLLAYPNLNHPYRASSNDFRPFLATQLLNEPFLLWIFIVLFHPILLNRTVYWTTCCPFVAAFLIWKGLYVQAWGPWDGNGVLIMSRTAPSVSWANNRCPTDCWLKPRICNDCESSDISATHVR